MISLIVLGFSFIIFFTLGMLGVPLFQHIEESLSYAFACMLLLTASAHFTPMKEGLIKMVPPVFRYPRQIVFITGILEILGAIGLCIPLTRNIAAICLILLLAAMLPANIHAATNKVIFRGKPATALWIRIPMQVLYVGILCWIVASGSAR